MGYLLLNRCRTLFLKSTTTNRSRFACKAPVVLQHAKRFLHLCIRIYGCFLKWWYPQNTPKWSFLVGKPMVVGYHHFRKPPYIYTWNINPSNNKWHQVHTWLTHWNSFTCGGCVLLFAGCFLCCLIWRAVVDWSNKGHTFFFIWNSD